MVGLDKKQALLNQFIEVLQMTDSGKEIVELKYDDSIFAVHVKFSTGYQRVIPVKDEPDEGMLIKILSYLQS